MAQNQPKSTVIAFEAELWVFNSTAAWFFVTLPLEAADQVRSEILPRQPKAFGSVRVHASIGVTNFATSLFPDKATQSYHLPIKASVRKAERLNVGDQFQVRIRLA